MVEPGQRTLAGRYELHGLLATGGMGQVWRARDVLLGRAVAVKVLRSEYTGDPTFLARFRAEAQHSAVLSHRNIATVFDYGEVPAGEAGEHLAYLVMELVDGEPLSTRLTRERWLGVPETLDLLQQTAAGLAAAHAVGVVHRDVKPGNLLMGSDGVVKITDFGIAWSASDVPLTQTGHVVGTAHYLSPEQAEGEKAGPASDVYALGMIAYECLAGRRAFDGGNAVQIALRHVTDVPDPLPADVPEAVRALVGRALLKDPVERFPDGAAFRDAVAEVRAGRAVPAAPPPLLPVHPDTTPLAARPGSAAAEPVPRSRLRRALTPVAALTVGAVLGVAGLQLFGGSGTGAPVASAHTHAATGSATSVVVSAGDYLGRPFGDAEAALAGLDLRVKLVPMETPDVAAGLVTAVSPTGALRRGDSVTVTYATAPAAQQAPVSPVQQVAVAPAASSSVAAQSPVPATAGAGAAGVGTVPAPGPGPVKRKEKDEDKGKPPGPGKPGHGHDG